MLQVGFVFLVLSSVVQLLFFRLGNRRLHKPIPQGHISPEDITVLIPFRNEENRILPLLASLNRLSVIPAQILFIDDHSDDQTASIIYKQLANHINFRVIQLQSGLEGKKSALRLGVEQVKTEYFITWDADCKITKDYFNMLPFLGFDLVVLPVVFDRSSWKHAIMQLDVLVLNAFNRACAAWFRPIVSSGANLLIKRSAFLDVDKRRNDYSISSGDDMFLLKAFRENKFRTKLDISRNHLVETASPEDWSAYVHQRSRWGKKSKHVGDDFANAVGLSYLLQLVIYLAVMLVLLLNHQFVVAVCILVVRQLVHLVSFYSYFRQVERIRLLWLLPLVEWLWCFLFMAVALRSNAGATWKGRINKV